MLISKARKAQVNVDRLKKWNFFENEQIGGIDQKQQKFQQAYIWNTPLIPVAQQYK